MFVNTYYYYYEKLFSHEFCDYVIKRGNSLKKQAARIGSIDKAGIINPKVRNSNIIWINDKEILDPIKSVMQEANKKANWNFNLDLNLDLVAQFTIYNKNQHYHWHCDSYKTERNRKLSFTLNLSDPNTYKGGDFEFDFKENKNKNKFEKLSFLKSKGSCVVFPSFLYHRVTPVKKGTRYSLVVWLSGPNWR
jgi:PKHD-type hydroxylase